MNSNKEWEKWGSIDPLWAVASWPGKEKEGENPWKDEEFYNLGASDWSDFWPHWKSYGCVPEQCLEIGCGAGRITKQLASCFSEVTAIDISQDQLNYARSRINASNVTFAKTDGINLPLSGRKVTAVFSVHVFQHFDSHQDAAAVFSSISRSLKSSGTLMIHLPLYSLPKIGLYRVANKLIHLTQWTGKKAAAVNRKRGKLIMRGLKFDEDWVDSNLLALGFSRIEFKKFRVKSNNDLHTFVLATK